MKLLSEIAGVDLSSALIASFLPPDETPGDGSPGPANPPNPYGNPPPPSPTPDAPTSYNPWSGMQIPVGAPSAQAGEQTIVVDVRIGNDQLDRHIIRVSQQAVELSS